MLPVGLGGIIAKPLVGYFVGQQVFHLAVAFYRILRIKDSAGILHATEYCFRLYIGQLPVGIGPYVLNKKRKDAARKIIIVKTFFPVFGIYPAVYRYTAHIA